jgi:purine-binding chemotaxis protein CheW
LTIEDPNSLHLCFELDDRTYALNANHVLEVTKLPLINKPHRLSEYIVGLLNYNDLFINVIDIRKIFNLSPKKYELSNKVIILKGDESLIAFITDSVSDFIDIIPAKTQRITGESHDKIIKSFYKNGEKIINIIDILQIEEIVKRAHLEENKTDYSGLFPNDTASLTILKQRSTDIATVPEMNMDISFFGKDQYVIFTVNEHKYCIYSFYVKKLINLKHQTITPIPNTPGYIKGIMNLKGIFYTVVDLKKFIGFKAGDMPNEIIVIESSELKLAFIVDDVVDIIHIPEDKIVKKNEIKLDELYVKEEAYLDNKIYNILNMDKLIHDERLYVDNSG